MKCLTVQTGIAYTLIVLSSLTETSLSPEWFSLTPQTWSWCSLKVWTHCLVLTSHTLTQPSLLPDTRCSLSGEKLTEMTQETWPDMLPSRVALLMSYSFMWPSSDPVNSFVLSGLKPRVLQKKEDYEK